MEVPERNFERVARREAEIIECLSSLCRDLISQLGQYTDMEAEEKRLKEIMEEPHDGG